MTEAVPVAKSPADQPPRDVAADEIYEQFPAREPKPKSFLESWGVKFMLLLLGAIILITLLFLLAWFATRPRMEGIAAILGPAEPNNPAVVTARVDAFAKLCQNHLDNYRDLFQLLILGGLVPLFTLIAGYVFGRNQAEKKQQEES